MTDTTIQAPKHDDRFTRWLLIAIGIYSGLLVTLLNVHILSSGSTQERAVILMADGLILFWIIIGGSLTPWLRRWLVPKLTAIPLGWRVRFVLLCTAMGLLEEVITTSMTNLAPLLGTTPEEAHITASTNYLVVVCFHSIVVFVPMFVAWAWMLSRWDFSPLKVLLLFGITGSIAEASMNPANLIGGFWVFVYGLMVYLPACTVPVDRGAIPIRLGTSGAGLHFPGTRSCGSTPLRPWCNRAGQRRVERIFVGMSHHAYADRGCQETHSAAGCGTEPSVRLRAPGRGAFFTPRLVKAEPGEPFPRGSLSKYLTRAKAQEELALLKGCSLEVPE
jgi:hypothetical protein